MTVERSDWVGQIGDRTDPVNSVRVEVPLVAMDAVGLRAYQLLVGSGVGLNLPPSPAPHG